MPIRKATLVSATAIDLVNNLWRVTLIFDDDPANAREYTVRSRYPFKRDEMRRFRVIMKRDTIEQIRPIKRE